MKDFKMFDRVADARRWASEHASPVRCTPSAAVSSEPTEYQKKRFIDTPKAWAILARLRRDGFLRPTSIPAT